jgi:hypothetical protein
MDIIFMCLVYISIIFIEACKEQQEEVIIL